MPEKIDRVLTDHAANQPFAPTETAVENLKREGFDRVYPAADFPRRPLIAQVGDVMYDAALFCAAKAEEKTGILDTLGLKAGKYVLATIHRAENVDQLERLIVIMEALNAVARQIPVVLPLHPRTRARLHASRASRRFKPHTSLIVIDPVGYLEMTALEKNAAAIATDSGGVQKEAFFHEIPCVTLRSETEWIELVRLGWNALAPMDSSEAIAAQITAAIHCKPASREKPYGEGNSAARILEILTKCC